MATTKAALSLARVFERAGYAPHSGQRLIAAAKSKHRFRIICAGRRTGKSTHGGHELLAHAYEAYLMQDELDGLTNRREYWIVGPEYSDAEKEFRVIYSDLEKLGFPFDRPGTYYDANGGNMHISLFGGRFQVHCKSAKYPETLVGEGLDGVILAEAAKLKPSIWPKYIRPMLVDTRGWAIMSSTPEGKNWFYDEYMRAKTNPEYWSIRMPSWINDILFPLGKDDPELASLAAGLTEESFKQEIGADFADYVGKVFKGYDEDIHCRPLEYDPSLPTFGAVDYGFTNPMVFLTLQVDVWDNIYIIGEYYETGKLVDEAAREIKARGLVTPTMKTFYPDPASPGDSAVLQRDLGIDPKGGTGGEIKERINLIRKWLEIPKSLRDLPFGHRDRQPKLFIDPEKCPKTAFEFGAYRYPTNKREQDNNNPENPLKKDDHTIEALGRFMIGHYGNAATEITIPARQSKARLNTRRPARSGRPRR